MSSNSTPSSLTRKRAYSAQAVADKTLLYHLTVAPPRGKKIYYYVLVDPNKERAFLKALDGEESFNLTSFGTIVAAGYGDPSEELKHVLSERYNINLA